MALPRRRRRGVAGPSSCLGARAACAAAGARACGAAAAVAPGQRADEALALLRRDLPDRQRPRRRLAIPGAARWRGHGLACVELAAARGVRHHPGARRAVSTPGPVIWAQVRSHHRLADTEQSSGGIQARLPPPEARLLAEAGVPPRGGWVLGLLAPEQAGVVLHHRVELRQSLVQCPAGRLPLRLGRLRPRP